MISRSFIKNSFIYTVAGTLPMASAVILLPFYIHYLSTESFGAFSILLALSVLIQIIVTFSFDASIFVHYHDYKNEPQVLSSFISSSFSLISLIGLFVTMALLLSGDYVFKSIFPDQRIEFNPYGIMAVATGVMQSFFKVYNSLLQTRQKPTLFLRSNLLSFSFIAGFTIIGLQQFPDSLLGPIGGRMLASVISGGWCFFRIIREFGFHWDYKLIRSSLSFNFYSFIYQIQQWLMNYFDRILMSFFLPLSDVGVYGFLMSCLMAVEFIVNGLYNSFSPKVIGLIVEQKQKGSTTIINRYYNGLTAASMVLVTASILFLPILIALFIKRQDYQLAIPFIPFAILIYLLKSMRLYFSIPFGILKYTKPLPVIYLVLAACRIATLILLIKPLGLYGVIVSSLLSLGLEVILLYYLGRQRFSFDFNIYKMIVAPLVLIFIIIVLEPLLGVKFPAYLHAGYFIACLILLIWVFRNEVKLIDPFKILTSK